MAYGTFTRVAVSLRNRLFGFEHSTVTIAGQKYLDRFIAYAGGTVRLHRFWRGDDDRAPHDHPWNFVTFPLTSYFETVFEPQTMYELGTGRVLDQHRSYVRLVKAFRFHRRDSSFRHIVLGRADGKDKPFWTIVFTGHVNRKWGFWPDAETYVYWRNWAEGEKS